ncbi:C40 family peptidase [Actinacidiphila bryophytorum]|uniref:C40 family peptidase n=1 Tax=Actinacidiphila bryophytorum TaxID=1436133 RepID=UPI002176A271|nr:C40 family peptidase [Actinacidiphila bryophytorum]UWE08883.1 C40 family peptidase [Actinacidiphila bryophytorum]
MWGATGPRAFDCSGLMQYAYGRAGVALPRTSQEQMNAGRRIPLDQARPGDLVIYRGDASHVAMYVGGGRVIHAPYPGARVRYDPVGMMPITAVTRP